MRALVTGGASGIGRATVLRLARDARAGGTPVKIAVVDVAQAKSKLDAVAEEVRKLDGAPMAIHADMASADGPGRAVGDAVARFGGLDALVSNAGINRPGALLSYTVEDWDALFNVNTRATWLLAKAAHDALTTAKGAIVITASMSGSNAHANLGAYAPSKAAVIMLMRVLAQEFGRDGIRVNSVSPGMVRTGMTEKVYENAALAAERATLVPLGRVATPEDIADVVAFLAGEEARWITGQNIRASGGII
jgi:glucose 1-dehydrogenase